MRRITIIGAAICLAVTGYVASAGDGSVVDHATVRTGENFGAVAQRLCPQNPSAMQADLVASNRATGPVVNAGEVLHYHPDVCAGAATISMSTTLATTTIVDVTTSSPTSTTSSTVVANTTVAAATTSTTSTTTSTTSTTTTTSTTAAPTTTSTTTTVPTSPAPPTTAPAGLQFAAGFASPSDLDRFTWQVFHGGADPFQFDGQPMQWRGDHDVACGGPTTQRDVHLHGATRPGPLGSTGELVWWCAPAGPDSGHFMTSVQTVGYAHIDFSPSQVFNDLTEICWSQNMTDMSRKWTQVTVVPEVTFRANGGRMEYVQSGLQNDVAVSGLRVEGETWQLSLARGSTVIQHGQVDTLVDFIGFTTSDKARRFRHCIRDTGSGIRLSLERPSSTETRTAPGGLPDGPVRVIFQDVTYDGLKEAHTPPLTVNTWHWDDIEIR